MATAITIILGMLVAGLIICVIELIELNRRVTAWKRRERETSKVFISWITTTESKTDSIGECFHYETN